MVQSRIGAKYAKAQVAQQVKGMDLVYNLLGRLRTAYCWVFRPVTLGVKALVLDKQGHVLLVEHTYKSGWYLPGGGIDRGESALDSVQRELKEEAGIECSAAPQLVTGLFYNQLDYKNDHIALFVVREWHYLSGQRTSPEIKSFGFFDPQNLPEGTTNATRRKIEEVLSGTLTPFQW